MEGDAPQPRRLPRAPRRQGFQRPHRRRPRLGPAGRTPERIYLKRSLHRHPVDKFLSLFRDSKEWREFQLALKFREAGILVPDPLYYSEAVDAEGHRAVFLATRALDRDWIEAKTFFKAERRFAAEWESLARFTRELHQRGILHADYRSDHLYLHQGRLAAGNDLATWALIDLDGSRTGITVTARQRDRALRQLAESLLTSGLTEPDLAAFLRLYDPDNRHRLDPAAIHAFAKGRHKAKG